MKSIYQIVLLLSVFILAVSCQEAKTDVVDNEMSTAIESDIQTNSITVSEKQFEKSAFVLGKMEQIEFHQSMSVTGTIHLPEKNKAAVSSFVSGTLGVLNLVEGEWVSKGQNLCTITNPELINIQEDFLVLRSQIGYLREEFERQQLLAADNINTKKTLLKAKSELRTAEARYAALKQKLSLYGLNPDYINPSTLISSVTISAPIAGYISAIHVTRGTYIEVAKPIVEIANNNNIHLELKVLEKDLSHLKKGQKITFAIQGKPDKKYTAQVHLIGKTIGENHMVLVNCRIDKADKKGLLPGMFITAEILTTSHKNWALPEDAVINFEDNNYVLVQKEKAGGDFIFDKIQVKKGLVQNGYTEILNGEQLPTTSDFLTKGAYYLILGE